MQTKIFQQQNSEKTNQKNDDRSESNKSIHQIQEIKKIEGKNKHYTATVKINGKKKEFIIDTGSPITIMPPVEEFLKSTGLQKFTNKYHDVKKRIAGKNSGKSRIRK